jgi:hypothetical protein
MPYYVLLCYVMFCYDMLWHGVARNGTEFVQYMGNIYLITYVLDSMYWY